MTTRAKTTGKIAVELHHTPVDISISINHELIREEVERQIRTRVIQEAQQQLRPYGGPTTQSLKIAAWVKKEIECQTEDLTNHVPAVRQALADKVQASVEHQYKKVRARILKAV